MTSSHARILAASSNEFPEPSSLLSGISMGAGIFRLGGELDGGERMRSHINWLKHTASPVLSLADMRRKRTRVAELDLTERGSDHARWMQQR